MAKTLGEGIQKGLANYYAFGEASENKALNRLKQMQLLRQMQAMNEPAPAGYVRDVYEGKLMPDLSAPPPRGFVQVGGQYQKDPGYINPLEQEEKRAAIEANQALTRYRTRSLGRYFGPDVNLKHAQDILTEPPAGESTPATGLLGLGANLIFGAKRRFAPEQEILRQATLRRLQQYGGGQGTHDIEDDDALLEEYQTTNDPSRAQEIEEILSQRGYQFK